MIAVSVLSAFQRAQRSDHLGSSSVSYRADGQQTITQRYYPWGTIRPGPNNALPTDYTFTGQKLDESTGLMYYGARYYDAALGRFVQADTIVPNPGNPQDLNRYAYVRNNPLRYVDPTGYTGVGYDPGAYLPWEWWEEPPPPSSSWHELSPRGTAPSISRLPGLPRESRLLQGALLGSHLGPRFVSTHSGVG